jgi:hypothetical protein
MLRAGNARQLTEEYRLLTKLVRAWTGRATIVCNASMTSDKHAVDVRLALTDFVFEVQRQDHDCVQIFQYQTAHADPALLEAYCYTSRISYEPGDICTSMVSAFAAVRPRRRLPSCSLRGVATLRYGDESPEHLAAARRGSGMIVAFRKGAGEIFHAGTSEWVNGLRLREAFTETITRTVVRRLAGLSELDA